MRRVPRWLVFALVVVVIAAGGLASGVIGTVRRPLPQLSGEIQVPGLSDSVEVLRDEYGVPQVYAAHPEDLFEAQGFVAAQDRFFEMDVRRHAAAGRLSELFGASQVETDTYIRTLGWRRTAEQELALLAPSTRRYLDAYASGVNAYLRGRSPGQISLEYSILGLQGVSGRPEDWTAVDSLAIVKVFGWQLGANAGDEAQRERVAAVMGVQRAADLYPTHTISGYDPVVERGTVVDKAFDPDASASRNRPLASSTPVVPRGAQGVVDGADRARATLRGLFGTGSGLGSNSWVVSGAHTVSGAPMLSNDPHLATSIPSPFAQVGLHCTTLNRACAFDVAGFSITGVPGVVIGRNQQIAWGLTTSYPDVQDLYLEQVVGNTVRVGTRYQPLTVRTEQIKVAGEDQPRTITIRTSRHGPLLSDADPDTAAAGRVPSAPGGAYAVALAWTGFTPGRSMDALLGFDTAQDWTHFRAAASLLSVPSQHLVYADTSGHIGYQLPGLIPVRRSGDGSAPVPGWTTTYDWTGTIPFAELPYAYDPPSGIIVTANQPAIGSQYPYIVSSSSASYGWRSEEIRDRLEAAGKLTPDTGEAVMYDDRSRFAAELVPALLKISVADAWVREGQQTLVGWNYRLTADSAAAAYYEIVLHDLQKLTFGDQIPQEDWPSVGDRQDAVFAALLKQPDNPWWDDKSTPQVEKRDDVLLAALTLARKEATSLMSRDTGGWSWGRIHQVRLRNGTLGMSGIAPVEAIFNREQAPVGGDGTTVKALGWDPQTGYAVTFGSTMRMLVDLGSTDGGRWVNQTGASGHPFGPYYDDQTALWLEDRTWPFVLTRAAVTARTVQTLVLKPEG